MATIRDVIAQAEAAAASASASAAALADMQVRPKVNEFFTAPDIITSVTGSANVKASGAGPALAVPVHKSISIDGLACIVDTLLAASTIRLGIYDSDSDGRPRNLLGSTSVSGNAAGVAFGTIGAPIVIPAGLYWLAARVSTTSTLRLRAVTTSRMRAVVDALATNRVLEADFGNSAALTATIASHPFGTTADTALVGIRRSA